MMNVNIIALGKIKESFYREACAEYLKRLSPFAKVTVKEPEPEALPHDPSKAQIEAALKREAEAINSCIKSGVRIAMCIEGKQLSSEQLAEKLLSLANESSTVSFIVGSSFGLAESFKQSCDFRISMSPMTFPHSLARVMLLEQIYRAFSINNNGKYHK